MANPDKGDADAYFKNPDMQSLAIHHSQGYTTPYAKNSGQK
jgi:hypothetical protein